MSTGTVSEHLSVMVDSGLLQSRRRGREVLYSRTHVADLRWRDGALRRLEIASA
jgi:DNA-binding transcriptional ArsR family regulator